MTGFPRAGDEEIRTFLIESAVGRFRMRRVWIVAAACVLCVLPVRAIEPARAAYGQQTTPDGFPAADGAPIVKLVSTGAEPRVALRYNVPAGAKGRVDMTTSMAMSMDMAGMAMPEMAMPVMKTSILTSVTSVAANGDMVVRSESTPMVMDMKGVDPMLAGAFQGAETGTGGLVATSVMDSRGRLRGTKIDSSAIVNPQMKQMADQVADSMKSIAAALPEEPVGVGAKWETRTRTVQAGVESFQTMTMEVVSIAGPKVTFKATMASTTPAQTLNLPGMPDGASARVRDFKGTGSGTTVIDLSNIVTEGEMTMKIAVALNLSIQGMEQPMSMTTTVKVKMTAGK